MDRTKNFSFRGNEYKIEFPTIGQYFDIETDKMLISKNKWGELILAKTVSSFRALQSMECVVVLKNLCPDLFKDFKVSSYSEIDAKDFLDLTKIYLENIQPWYSEWFKEFNEILEKPLDNIN